MKAINVGRGSAPIAEPTARVLSLARGPGVTALSGGDLERIRDAVLRVLEEVGIGIGSPLILERLAAGGAVVEAGRVRFPADLIEQAIRSAPSELLLAARDPACDLRVDGTQGWLGTGGPAASVTDAGSDEHRPPTLTDVAAVSRLADALPQIGFVGSPAHALDVPGAARPLEELHALLAGTSKHVQIEIDADGDGASATLEIARTVGGGDAAFRARPVVSAFLLLDTPFTVNRDRLEATLALAEGGIPCGFVAAPVAGASVPATVAGALVTAAAEAVAGVAILQLLVPGAPTFLGTRALEVSLGGGHSAPGGPQDPSFQMAWIQLVRRFDLPAHIGAFATGSKTSDWQAGFEGGLSGTAAWIMGPDLVAAAGLRDGGRLFSPIGMLLDAELFDLTRRIPLGFDVDDETLALDVIEKVGPGEHFLGEPHTLRHMREAWRSRFMDTDTWEAWEEKARPEPPERAAERARELLGSHEPMPLTPHVEEHIREVIAAHVRDHAR